MPEYVNDPYTDHEMRWFWRVLRILLLLAIGAWAFLFALENSQPVGLVLVPFELPARSIGFWVLLAFIVGGCIGLLASSMMFLRQRRRERQLRRALRDSGAELASERQLRQSIGESATALAKQA